ncbi:MAG: hypothetical protein GXO70_04525 [Acidobacteria bacterium]|nr:hypothetical protein [Acidobacteriota bacterium]
MKKSVILFPLFVCFAIAVNAESSGKMRTAKASGPGTYRILKKTKGPVIIPFRMHMGKPLMDVEVNGKKATMMIDNGILWDQVWLFGSPLVKELQLKPIDKSTIIGAGEGDPTQAYTAVQDLTIKFKDVVFCDQPVYVSPPAAGFARMFPGADGQLCNTFFKHFIVEFDFIKNQVILHDPDTFQYKGKGSVLDMQENKSGTHSVPFSFTMPDGKTYSGQVDIDFGGVHILKIALNNKLNIPLPSGVRPATSYGAQGKGKEYMGKIRQMTIGKYTFNTPKVFFGDEKTSRIHPGNLGVIGLPMFMKFDIIFDYIHNKIYIEPNKNYSDDQKHKGGI